MDLAWHARIAGHARIVAAFAGLLLTAACSAGMPPPQSGPPSAEPSVEPSALASARESSGSPTSPAAASASASPSASPTAIPALTADPLHRLVLIDVRTGEELTLGQLAAEKPVLLETMAIWCTNCRAQMHRVVEAHGAANFHSVGIDVDPSERAEDLKAYVEREGFDWPFAMADAEVAGTLRDRLGQAFMFPPNTPMVLLMPDGEVRPLDFGGYSVDELLAELAG
jgi:thiol-disulfide isomerase/thioredoxin